MTITMTDPLVLVTPHIHHSYYAVFIYSTIRACTDTEPPI